MISQLYIEGLSLGHYLIWKHIIIIGNRNLYCFYEQRGRQQRKIEDSANLENQDEVYRDSKPKRLK